MPLLAKELNKLLESNEAVALAYCPQCQGIMQLNPELHCSHHPTARLKDVYFSLPYNLEALKRQMMHKHHENKSISTRYSVAFVIILIALVIVYFALIK